MLFFPEGGVVWNLPYLTIITYYMLTYTSHIVLCIERKSLANTSDPTKPLSLILYIYPNTIFLCVCIERKSIANASMSLI